MTGRGSQALLDRLPYGRIPHGGSWLETLARISHASAGSELGLRGGNAGSSVAG